MHAKDVRRVRRPVARTGSALLAAVTVALVVGAVLADSGLILAWATIFGFLAVASLPARS